MCVGEGVGEGVGEEGEGGAGRERVCIEERQKEVFVEKDWLWKGRMGRKEEEGRERMGKGGLCVWWVSGGEGWRLSVGVGYESGW